MTRVAVVLASVLVLAGCSSSPPASSPSSSPVTTTTGCAPAGATVLTVRLRQVDTSVTVVGNGRVTVLLSNQSDEDHCSWTAYASTLAGQGYRVASWDYADTSGLDAADQVAAVEAAVAQADPGPVVLMGASKGAKASIVAAAHHPEGVAGVVSLSAEASLPPSYQVAKEAAAVKAPLLLVTADHDPYGSAEAGAQIQAALPAAKLVTVPGTDHGTALLAGSAAATVTSAVSSFLGSLPH